MPHLFDALRLKGVTFTTGSAVRRCASIHAPTAWPDWHWSILEHAAGRRRVGLHRGRRRDARGADFTRGPGRLERGLSNRWSVSPGSSTARRGLPAFNWLHAGRKGSTYRPWSGQGMVAPKDGGWQTLAPSVTTSPTTTRCRRN